MKFIDENGYLKLVICGLFLCIQHGLRDYFITALPLIAYISNGTEGNTASIENIFFTAFNLKSNLTGTFLHEERKMNIPSEGGDQLISFGGSNQPIFYGRNGQPISYVGSEQPISYGESNQPISYGESGQPISYGESGQPILYGESGQPISYGESGQPISHGESEQPILYKGREQHIPNTSLYLQYDPLVLKEEWTSGRVGLSLSIIHWTWTIPLVLSPFIIQRIAPVWSLASCLISSAFVAFFSEWALTSGGSSGLIVLRAIQGLAQGWSYPIVYLILQDLQCPKFVFPYFIVFLAPWFGTALGMLMGGAGPFLACYVFGTLSICLAALSFLVPLSCECPRDLPENAWKETLSSFAVWACVGVQMGAVWALHTIFVGMVFTLDLLFYQGDLYWSVFIVVLVGGVATRLTAQVAMSLLRNHFLSALNRRRVVIMTGSILVACVLVMNGTIGLNSVWNLLGVSVLGLCLGTSLCIVGVRLNMHDLGPSFPVPFLLLGSVGASIGAACSSLLFPIILQVDDGSSNQFLQAWLVPIAVIFVICVGHLFLLSVNPLPHQIVIRDKGSVRSNGIISSLHLPANRKESDAKSFKSIRSALTFKTAVSRQRSRTRTISLRTVREDNDDDVYSFAESEECRSAFPDDDVDDYVDMRSIKSSFTYKTAIEEQGERNRGVILNVEDLDRTNEWLTTYHNTGSRVAQIIAEEKEKAERNVLLSLQW